MRNSNQKVNYPRSLGDIPHLSNSNVTIFEECPRRWASNYIFGEKGPSGVAAKVGSALHEEMETVQETRQVSSVDKLVAKGVKKDEAIKAINYQHRHVAQPIRPSLVEQEFYIKLSDDIPQILAYIDQLDFIDEETVLITDHKSNRRIDSLEEWKKKLQPPLYALIVRTHYPQVKTVKFKIGYIMFEQDLEWEISKEESDAVISRIQMAWDAMKAYGRGTSNVPNLLWFPEVVGDGCQWCHLKSKCKSFQDEIAAPFQALNVTDQPKEAQIKAKAIELDILESRKKLIEAAVKETKEALTELVENKPIIIDNVKISFKSQNRRKINVVKFLEGLEIIQNEMDLPVVTEFWSSAHELIEFKLGELDKYIKGHSYIESLVNKIVETKPTNPSISVEIS